MLQSGELDPAATRSADLASLPPYLRRHVQLGFDQEDITALLSSIDASQTKEPASSCFSTTPVHLPAELLLQIVENVPIDYLLDWRLVCRGFRDAIDGRVLFDCLQRTRLLGYLGHRDDGWRRDLEDVEYEQIHMYEARFLYLEKMPGGESEGGKGKKQSIWSGSHAVFGIDDEWYRAFDRNIRAMLGQEDPEIVDDFNSLEFLETLDRLVGPDFGKLDLCIALDHAVLDLDFSARLRSEICIDFKARRISRVPWRDMLVHFLKTERALRLLLDEKRTHPTFTFSHREDCLRAIRRARLSASLDMSIKTDRHIQWSLRLLRPLYGLPYSVTSDALTMTKREDDAIRQLLVLRRAASLSTKQLAYLHALASDYNELEGQVLHLNKVYSGFVSYFCSLSAGVPHFEHVPINPVAWPDELREKIEGLVAMWRAQRSTLEQVKSLLQAGMEAMSVPEDAFSDDEGASSEF